jgi:hypothetical protein
MRSRLSDETREAANGRDTAGQDDEPLIEARFHTAYLFVLWTASADELLQNLVVGWSASAGFAAPSRIWSRHFVTRAAPHFLEVPGDRILEHRQWLECAFSSIEPAVESSGRSLG